MWHEWNVNAGDVMVTWCASYVNLMTSCFACALHTREHGTCEIINMGTFNYLNSLTGMPAESNLMKLTVSHLKP